MTSTLRAVIHIDVDTAITTIIEATRIVSLIIAYTISNQCDVTSTIWKKMQIGVNIPKVVGFFQVAIFLVQIQG